jgi:hypothetical protein
LWRGITPTSGEFRWSARDFRYRTLPFRTKVEVILAGFYAAASEAVDRSAFLRNLRSLIGSSPAANDEAGRQRGPILCILIEAARPAPLFAR